MECVVVAVVVEGASRCEAECDLMWLELLHWLLLAC